MPIAVYALTAGAFGIGTTEFTSWASCCRWPPTCRSRVDRRSADLGLALGVFVGAPVITPDAAHAPQGFAAGLMAIFTLAMRPARWRELWLAMAPAC